MDIISHSLSDRHLRAVPGRQYCLKNYRHSNGATEFTVKAAGKGYNLHSGYIYVEAPDDDTTLYITIDPSKYRTKIHAHHLNGCVNFLQGEVSRGIVLFDALNEEFILSWDTHINDPARVTDLHVEVHITPLPEQECILFSYTTEPLKEYTAKQNQIALAKILEKKRRQYDEELAKYHPWLRWLYTRNHTRP